MKDEIKEIKLLNDIANGNYKEVISKEAKNLLDYITNLQEENERLKELCDKYEEEHNTAFKLWTTKMEKIPTYEEKKELQDRIDKAIEYIEKEKYDIETTFRIKSKEFLQENVTSVVPSFKLLEILKGE